MALASKTLLFVKALLLVHKHVICHECKEGYYGEKCESPCGHCAGGPVFCDPFTGMCFNGCARGYVGKVCNEKCSPGTYGIHCQQTCSPHCLDPVCDFQRGNCSELGCHPGYIGKDCSQVCPLNRYGLRCEKTCDCNTFCGCDPVSGICNRPEICTPLKEARSVNSGEDEDVYAANVNAVIDPVDPKVSGPRSPTLPGGEVHGAMKRNAQVQDRPDAPNTDPAGEDLPDNPKTDHPGVAPSGPGQKSQGEDLPNDLKANRTGKDLPPSLKPKPTGTENVAGDGKTGVPPEGKAGTQMMCSKLEREFADLREKLNNKVDIPWLPLIALLIVTTIILVMFGLWDMWQHYKRELYMANWERENLDQPLEAAALLARNSE